MAAMTYVEAASGRTVLSRVKAGRIDAGLELAGRANFVSLTAASVRNGCCQTLRTVERMDNLIARARCGAFDNTKACKALVTEERSGGKVQSTKAHKFHEIVLSEVDFVDFATPTSARQSEFDSVE
ncbi:hypothetical protein FRC01_009546 [Tulasnella sp. 417]|nr:hypothetical protein FRC01_009546 [Tulasnella sp. 417]